MSANTLSSLKSTAKSFGLKGIYMKSNTQHYLDDYPLKEHYSTCENYLYNTLNWKLISRRISEEGVICFDISDVLALFPHLELDENYKLFCYLSREYHGIWGRIAAIKNGDSCEPVIDPDKEWVSKLFHGCHFDLPNGAIPPMEAIYNDGTPHGYFEAILAEEFIGAIPYTQFEQEHWDRCILYYPRSFPSDWNIYEKISDLRPHITITRYGSVVVSMCWQHFENGIGASDGCDTIRLAQHTFAENLEWHHFAANIAKEHTMYKAQIDDDSRYRKGRHCSASTERSITVAIQKDWQTLSKVDKNDSISTLPGTVKSP